MDIKRLNTRKNRCPTPEERVELEQAVEKDRQFLHILSDQLASRIQEHDQKHAILQSTLSLLEDAQSRRRNAIELKTNLQKCLLPLISPEGQSSEAPLVETSTLTTHSSSHNPKGIDIELLKHPAPARTPTSTPLLPLAATSPPRSASAPIFSHKNDKIVEIRQEMLSALSDNMNKTEQEIFAINVEISTCESDCQVAVDLYETSQLLIPEITNQIEAVKTAIKIKQRRLSPIWKVPEDIWREIFGIVALSPIYDPVSNAHTSAFSLSTVCHNWRLISRAYPILWTHITIDISHIDRQFLSRLNHHVLLSSKLPLKMTIYSTGGSHTVRAHRLGHILSRVRTLRCLVSSGTVGKVQEFLGPSLVNVRGLEIVGDGDPNIQTFQIPSTMRETLRRLVARGIPFRLQGMGTWELAEIHCSETFPSAGVSLGHFMTSSLRRISWDVVPGDDDVAPDVTNQANPASVEQLDMPLAVLHLHLKAGWSFPNLSHLSIKGLNGYLVSWDDVITMEKLVGPTYRHTINISFFPQLHLLSTVQTLELWNTDIDLILPLFLLTPGPTKTERLKGNEETSKNEDQNATGSTSHKLDINYATANPIVLPQINRLIVNEYRGDGKVILSVAKERNDLLTGGAGKLATVGTSRERSEMNLAGEENSTSQVGSVVGGKSNGIMEKPMFRVELNHCDIYDRDVLFGLLPYRS